MKIKTIIGYGKVTMTEPKIEEAYHIEENQETGKFYVWSENGYNSEGIFESSDLSKVINHVKKTIKEYFMCRGLDNPKGW